MSPPNEGENKWENMDLDGLFEQTRMKCNNGPTGVWTQDPRGWYGPFIRGPRIISGPISTGWPQAPIQTVLYPPVIIKRDGGAPRRLPRTITLLTVSDGECRQRQCGPCSVCPSSAMILN